MYIAQTLLRHKKHCVVFVIVLVLFVTYLNSDARIIWNLKLQLDDNHEWTPNKYDNNTGWPTHIVPDIVHYILFDYHRISYSNMLSLLSVIRNHRPAMIWIHCDCEAIEAGDPNWTRVLHAANSTNITAIHIVRTVKPTEINGIHIKPENANYHASDITRYRLMSEYGGIYVDNDVFVCQSLHDLRRFEFTLNWDEGQYLGSQVLVGHKNARFLKMVLRTYEAYDTNRWYWNAGELPTKVILWKFPFVVHRIKKRFGVDAPVACQYFYKELHTMWTMDYYTFHMAMRGNQISHKNWCLGDDDHPLKHAVFTDDLIKSMNNTFGEMARQVLWPKNDG